MLYPQQKIYKKMLCWENLRLSANFKLLNLWFLVSFTLSDSVNTSLKLEEAKTQTKHS